jgi:Arc/MetJ-type ribon-helix-helix transcriptional regulator
MSKMISLRIPDELHDEIKERAKNLFMLPSEYIRKVLRNHIESTVLSSESSPKEHFKWYEGTTKFKCLHCGRHFWGKESYISLRRHLVEEHDVEKKEIQDLYDI